MPEIGGVYVANVTPFVDDGSLAVDEDAYLDHVSWLAEIGVRGIVPFGTNGEGPSVTLGEKLRVLEALFGRALPLQIIPAIMQNNLPETLDMLRALEDYPATAVLVLPPYYFKPVEPEGMVRFYEPVLGATGHTIIVYHIPKYALPVPHQVVKKLPVWGVKDSGGEEGYAEAVLEGGKGVLLGTEDDLWRRLGTGAQGVISALANFIPEEVLELYEKHGEGDEAGGTALSEKLQKARTMTKEYASPAVLKKLAQARHGARMGTVRPPFVPVPADYEPEPALEAVRPRAGG
ncbi:MAG: dihydrodipicolinate synthase family protein [Actinomycetota bacterium]|jgi:4-hydroxy-tetrahydrodipicolinate synthase|nr:dihydrodipicolinate synthase family protein [Rubrobacteraceae bacterium]MDQ3184828.1 dihydrodipicolinate synthase family protein [Actinomycetota bacterium]MDQ3497437.1 dihydrodipicolinate synthase family protein [Actinomycetota bacterium]